MGKGFAFTTLAEATLAAQQHAGGSGEPYYVVEAYHDMTTLHQENTTPPPLPTHAVNFAWYPAEDVGLLLSIEHPSTGIALTILRVAYPDGTIAALTDPGDRAGRIALLGLEQ